MKFNIIYMASGLARRFGSNKLLYKFKGKEIYLYGLETMIRLLEKLQSAGLNAELIVVSSYPDILNKAKSLGVKGILNTDSSLGISSSIKLGTAYSKADFYLYMPADMPFVNEDSVFELCKEASRNKEKSLFALANEENTACSPCIFSDRYREELMGLKEDEGGKKVFCKYPQNTFLKIVSFQELKDIDYPEDL